MTLDTAHRIARLIRSLLPHNKPQPPSVTEPVQPSVHVVSSNVTSASLPTSEPAGRLNDDVIVVRSHWDDADSDTKASHGPLARATPTPAAPFGSASPQVVSAGVLQVSEPVSSFGSYDAAWAAESNQRLIAALGTRLLRVLSMLFIAQ